MSDLLRQLLMLPDPASEAAREIDVLHFVVLGTTLVGFLAVACVTAWWLWRYRRRGDRPTERVTGSRRLELSIGGALLTLFVGWWVVGFLQYLDLQDAPEGAEEIYVTGKQWMWKFAWPSGRAVVGVLPVPVDRDVRLVLTSRDVVHSFFVPALRMKQDALPGRFTRLDFRADRLGTYPVYCAEYCGQSHARMGATVVVLSAEDYADWVAGRTPATLVPLLKGREVPDVAAEGGLAAEGRRVMQRVGCLACHSLDGSPSVGPTLLGLYGSEVELQGGERVVADSDYLTRALRDPNGQIVAGYDPVMPSFEEQLSAEERVAIFEALRALGDEEAP
ncbi:MAG: cytochrome c oxidase subunit II [Myxococcales bacterium]|nr:cytochrome c oxidase subunit II [Myxococcales bacterium]